MSVYHTGLRGCFEGESVPAYSVNVTGAKVAEQVWLNAQTGGILNRIPLRDTALCRIAYTPKYDSSNPDLFVALATNVFKHW